MKISIVRDFRKMLLPCLRPWQDLNLPSSDFQPSVVSIALQKPVTPKMKSTTRDEISSCRPSKCGQQGAVLPNLWGLMRFDGGGVLMGFYSSGRISMGFDRDQMDWVGSDKVLVKEFNGVWQGLSRFPGVLRSFAGFYGVQIDLTRLTGSHWAPFPGLKEGWILVQGW